MQYVSTRGHAPVLGFEDALLAGLAPDGGLYVPDAWPTPGADWLETLAGEPFDVVAARILGLFANGEIDGRTIARLSREAYATFAHAATCPIVQTGPGDFVLELFHGPTLAFKDVAMQLLSRLMDHVLAKRGGRTTIVVATSGDTGGAAVDGFAGRDRADLFVLFPMGRVSDVQRRQMTTSPAANVHAIAVEGNFDDCQRIVKEMFGNPRFRDAVALSAVNSINWARIVAQVSYFVSASLALGGPRRPVVFSVPTGNFGDVFAGYVAKRLGVAIETLVVATNVNDILARALGTGVYDVRGVTATMSPSMDIQVSSNFERLLFDATGRDAGAVGAMMGSLKQSGRFEIPAPALAAIRAEFSAARVDEAGTARVMKEMLAASGYLLDPHTAVGVGALGAGRSPASVPRVTLATAHPAKFPAAVAAATGVSPALPPHLADLHAREERFVILPADTPTIERHVSGLARAARGAVA